MSQGFFPPSDGYSSDGSSNVSEAPSCPFAQPPQLGGYYQQGGGQKTERGYTEDGKKRYTVVETSYGELGGSYTGKYPSIAASKAATARFREYYKQTKKQPPPLTFAIRHVAHTDTFAYKAMRKPNNKPQNSDIQYKYINVVKALGKRL